MEQIKCPKCGAVDKFYTELKSNNNVARCSQCDTFIKNIPYQQPAFYFGKYKGKKVVDVLDLGYLKWYLGDIKSLTSPMRFAIEKQISYIENLSR